MAALDDLIAELDRSYEDAQARLSDPAVYNDHREAAEVGRRLKELEGPYKLAQQWKQAREDLEAARADPELAEMVGDYEADVERLEEELKLALAERDPADDKDVIVEIRQGVGGDEAALWAAELQRMLQRYAEKRGFKFEQIETNANEGGGLKEGVFAIKGDGAYSIFKFEGGTHRVQRVPETESAGRIHTSTATVAVMPEADDVDLEIDESDLKIDVYRSSGPGGQSVNTTDSAVRITHVPTGIVVAMQDERSQLQNREKAMRVLRARIYEAERERQAAEQAAARSAQVGTGARAEKIRTYNFPENRVTDHRIKLTTHRLDQVLQGDLEDYTDALISDAAAPRARRVTLGEVLRGATDYLAARGVEHPRLDAELLLARALGLSRIELYTAARPSADRRRAHGGARARAAARQARAARLRARRLGLPPADAARPTRARSCRGRRPRSSSSAVSSCSTAIESPRRRRRRHRQRRDRARDRAGTAGRPRARDRHLCRPPSSWPRENAEANGLAVEFREGDLLAGLAGPVRPGRLQPAVRRRRRARRARAGGARVGADAARSSTTGRPSGSRATRREVLGRLARPRGARGAGAGRRGDARAGGVCARRHRERPGREGASRGGVVGDDAVDEMIEAIRAGLPVLLPDRHRLRARDERGARGVRDRVSTG